MRVEVTNLTVTFPRRRITAVDDVSLTIEEGEQVALLGSSGSGKTTLLRTLLGAVVPVAGQVRVGDFNPFGSPSELRELRRATGVVRQGSDLVNGLTGRVNALMGSSSYWGLGEWLAVLRRSVPEMYRERLELLAEKHEVTNCLPARVEHLSGGQRQRIGLIRALLTGPKLLLADEPTAGLDVRTGEAAVEALFTADASTLVCTTHDLAVAKKFPRVIAMRDGKLIYDGADPTESELTSIYGAMA